MIRKAGLFVLALSILFSVVSCQKSKNISVDKANTSSLEKKGGKKNKDNPPSDPPPEIEYNATYQIAEIDDHDPLYRFSISQSGQLMLLQTDPTVTSWGTDYWGYWSSPYTYTNNQVNYIIGLTNTTYQFTVLPNNNIDVTKTLIVQPYLGGTPTTTITHPGVYTRIP